MYLTKFDINTTRRGGRHLLASSQRMHAAVLGSFAPTALCQADKGRVLWRVDRDGPRATLYVVSPARPDLSGLVEQAGWPTTSVWRTAEYRPFLDRLAPGQMWMFRLTANPVRSVSNSRDRSGRGTVRPHVTTAQQELWLLERAGRVGLRILDGAHGVPDLLVKDRRSDSFGRHANGRRTVTIAKATFEGRLEVTDADALRGALTGGIGRARAYGCGLMTLAAP